MSDFLVRIGHDCSSEHLLALVKQPYNGSAPEGRGFDFSWGSLAVLEDRLASNANIMTLNAGVLAWVGELVGGMSAALRNGLIARLARLQHSARDCGDRLADDPAFQQLNGAFAILFADDSGFSIVTDPLGATQVFRGTRSDGRVVSAGTHADTTAIAGGISDEMDCVSIAQFLRHEHCAFPHTMYRDIHECQPGAVCAMSRTDDGELQRRQWSYWSVPNVRTDCSEEDFADALRQAFVAAVADRCERKRIGVALSGGLDSRLVTAAVPDGDSCTAFTMCDKLNRETRTAQRVAVAYGRPWSALFRRDEYLADHLVDVVRFVGCECEFVHAHLFGFADTIAKEVDILLTGDLVDTLLRAYTAKDFGYRHRLGGLLPRRYERVPFDYVQACRDLWGQHLRQDVLDAVTRRLEEFHDRHAALDRGSVAESLKIYPFRQWVEVATWSAQRRRLPLGLVGADRRLLDFAFACPVDLKLGDKVFLKAAKGILGPGLHIPSANDGVRPGSGHLWRLVQRAIRKSQDRFTGIAERFGRKAPIQHSWHDYPAYWRESQKLAMLRRQYGPNLSCLDGVLFEGNGQALLEDTNLSWEHGFRLLQLAVWLGLRKEYASAACDASVSCSCPALDSTRGTNTAH